MTLDGKESCLNEDPRVAHEKFLEDLALLEKNPLFENKYVSLTKPITVHKTTTLDFLIASTLKTLHRQSVPYRIPHVSRDARLRYELSRPDKLELKAEIDSNLVYLGDHEQTICWDRSNGHSRGSIKIPRNAYYINHAELIISPESATSQELGELLDGEITLICGGTRTSSLTIRTNLLLAHMLTDHRIYEDLSGEVHIPLILLDQYSGGKGYPLGQTKYTDLSIELSLPGRTEPDGFSNRIRNLRASCRWSRYNLGRLEARPEAHTVSMIINEQIRRKRYREQIRSDFNCPGCFFWFMLQPCAPRLDLGAYDQPMINRIYLSTNGLSPWIFEEEQIMTMDILESRVFAIALDPSMTHWNEFCEQLQCYWSKGGNASTFFDAFDYSDIGIFSKHQHKNTESSGLPCVNFNQVDTLLFSFDTDRDIRAYEVTIGLININAQQFQCGHTLKVMSD